MVLVPFGAPYRKVVLLIAQDLNSAVQLLWNDATLHAYPILTGTQMDLHGQGGRARRPGQW